MSAQAYASSTEVLRQLLRSQDNEAHIHRISPKGYTLMNGVDYCHVGLKSQDGTDYSIQAYGKEAIQLHAEAARLRQDRQMIELRIKLKL